MGQRLDKATEAAIEAMISKGAATVVSFREPVAELTDAERRAEDKKSEKAFQAELIKYARGLGWTEYHVHFSQRSRAGFPDLPLFRERAIYAELKSESGALEPEQAEWRDILLRARQEWYLWRPSDWPKIVEVLNRKAK